MQFQCVDCDVYFVSNESNAKCPFCKKSNVNAAEEIDVRPGIQIDEFLFEEKIGEGAISQVFKAKDVVNNHTVVVKMPKNLFKNDVRYRKKYEHEAEILKSIDHENVVRLIKTLEVNNNLVLVTEYVDGVDLQKMLLLEGSIPVELTLDYLAQAALGLEQAHQKGIIHRDIKPDNFLVSRENVLKVADFGLAKFRNMEADKKNEHLVFSFQGTPAYAAPELIVGENPSVQTDIYSLGITAHQLCTGKLPFETGTVDAILFEHLNAEIQPARLVNPAISQSFEKLMLEMTDKEPDARPVSMQEVHDKLKEIKSSLSVRNTDFSEKKTSKTANHVYIFAALLLFLFAVGFQFTRMYFRNLERAESIPEKPTNTEMDFKSLLSEQNDVIDLGSVNPNVSELGDIYLFDEWVFNRGSSKRIIDFNEGKDIEEGFKDWFKDSFKVVFPNSNEIPSLDLCKSLRITENRKYILLQFTEITILGEVKDKIFIYKLSLPKSTYINTFFNDSEECFISFHEEYCNAITITPDNINVQKLALPLNFGFVSTVIGTPDKLKYILKCTKNNDWFYKIVEIGMNDDGDFEIIIPDFTLFGFNNDEMIGCDLSLNTFLMHRFGGLMVLQSLGNNLFDEFHVNTKLMLEYKTKAGALSISGDYVLVLCENPDDKTKYELRVYNFKTQKLVASKEISMPKDTTVNFANIYLKYKPDKIVLSINLTDSDNTFNQVFVFTNVNK